MTWDHVRWAARRAGPMDPTARLVLMTLAVHANPEGHAWPTVATLAGETGLDPSTVRRAMRRLEKDGWVKIDRSRGRRSSDVIFVQDTQPGHSARVQPGHSARQPGHSARQPGHSARHKDLEGDMKDACGEAELTNVVDLAAELRSRLLHPALGLPAEDS